MLPFLSVRHKPGWMAILIQGANVTLAHVIQQRSGRPEVTLLDSFAIEKDAVDALRRLRTVRALKAYACTTLMGDADYNLSQVDAPAVPREERKEALRWAIKEMVMYPVESACLDVLDIPSEGLPAGRSAGVLVVSAAEEAVRLCASPFVAAKVPLQAIDVPELAQRNVAALFEDENRGLAFLRLDEAGMMLTLTFHGELIAVRRGDMNTTQLASPDADQRARVRERLVLELQRSLDNFDRQYGQIAVSRVVLSMPADSERLLDALRAGSDLPVEPLDLASVLDLSAVPALRDPREQARHLLAIGAALRDEVAV